MMIGAMFHGNGSGNGPSVRSLVCYSNSTVDSYTQALNLRPVYIYRKAGAKILGFSVEKLP